MVALVDVVEIRVGVKPSKMTHVFFVFALHFSSVSQGDINFGL